MSLHTKPGQPSPHQVHVDQLCRILTDQQETCRQLAECAQEQQDALRLGKGSDFVRASLTQAHLARRFYFLEEERVAAVNELARILSADSSGSDLLNVLQKLPEEDARRVSTESQSLKDRAERVASVQKVNAQMIQTNIQLATALTRQAITPGAPYYGNQTNGGHQPSPSQLDQRI
jgi:hypothetical protein